MRRTRIPEPLILPPESRRPRPGSANFSQTLQGLGLLFTLLALGIAARLVWLQISPAWELIRRDPKRTLAWETRVYPVPRGLIVDRNGILLAGNRLVYQLDVATGGIRDPETVARGLAPVLGLDEALLARVLARPHAVVMLSASVTVAQREQLTERIYTWYKQGEQGPLDPKNWDIFRFIPRMERVYPQGDLASNILGFVSQREDVVEPWMPPLVGNYGLEARYQRWLHHRPVLETLAYDPFSVDPDAFQFPQEAPTLVLTLDAAIQAMAEEVLDRSLQTYQARRGVIVILRPKTGEILAMAMAPRPNLRHYEDVLRFLNRYQKKGWNWAVSHAYEPGSAMKPIILAIALETQAVTPDFQYDDSGIETPCGGIAPVRNWDYRGHGTQSLVGCLALSLNTCFAHIARRIPRATLLRYLEAFGFGQPTGVDLAAEVAGEFSVNTCVDHSRVGFGHAIAVTPLQLAAAMAALANDGVYMRPYLVAYRVAGEGVTPIGRPTAVRRVVSRKTARTVARLLAQALESDSYKNAVVPGYVLAGKTGTAFNPLDPNDLLDATMVGWGPVDDPQFVVLVWLEDPRAQEGWASLTAAPVFREVVSRLVVMLGIPPSQPSGEQARTSGGKQP